MTFEIVRLEATDISVLPFEADRIENYYKILVIVGAILLGIGLVV